MAAQRESTIVLFLHDFTFQSPEEVLAGLTNTDAPAMQIPGAAAPPMDFNDVDFDAFLANDRTLTDPEVVHVDRGGRVRLRIILATPGSRISRVADQGPIAPPIDLSLETQLAAAEPLRARRADLVRTILLGGSMKPYSWSINGEMWPHVTPLMVKQGQRVEFELVNRTMMAHPMHLHGHAFQVVAIDGRRIQGAMRDTVLVMPRGARVRIAFDANNPGRWAFHCHNLYHMQTGMMTEVRYDGIAA
jgi:uncharacterized cupredoxin-like copper-binding protein